MFMPLKCQRFCNESSYCYNIIINAVARNSIRMGFCFFTTTHLFFFFLFSRYFTSQFALLDLHECAMHERQVDSELWSRINSPSILVNGRNFDNLGSLTLGCHFMFSDSVEMIGNRGCFRPLLGRYGVCTRPYIPTIPTSPSEYYFKHVCHITFIKLHTTS